MASFEIAACIFETNDTPNILDPDRLSVDRYYRVDITIGKKYRYRPLETEEIGNIRDVTAWQ